MKSLSIKAASLAIAILTLLTSCSSLPTGTNSTISTSPTTSQQTTPQVTTTVPPETTETTHTGTTQLTDTLTTQTPIISEPTTDDDTCRLSLLAVGDNLIHVPLITSGQTFGYDSLYSGISDVISAADVAIINQETIFVYDPSKYSGYPKFGSPVEIGEAALEAGFDVFSTSTNHVCDKGAQGVRDTLDFWANHPEGTAIGIHDSKATRNDVTILEQNGIKVAYFNFTYGFNVGLNEWWMVERMESQDRIVSLFKYARENSDFIVVCAHWGTEYSTTPNTHQETWAQFFADQGADLIIGTHPHVVQPVTTITGESGNETLVYWSLGNFISNQEYLERNVGAMALVDIVKDESGTYIASHDIVPTTVQCEKIDGVLKFSAILLEQLTDEMLSRSSKFSDKTVDDFWDYYNSVIQPQEEVTLG